MNALRLRIQELFRSHQEIYQDAYENRQFNALYFAMLVFGCLIALLGLLLNSPAVIIGAMLISPLMGPILACGLALTLGDWSLGRKSLRNVTLSVIECVLIAAVATWLSPLKEPTPEIMARTSPNLMDLLVALFSGIAGTLALNSKSTAMTIVPGVAIATAVMPPLATTGYGIATGQWNVAGGSFMLFFTNLTTIAVSASLVFLVAGFRPQEHFRGEEPHILVRYRALISAVVLLALSVPLMRTLLQAGHQSSMRKEIHKVLRADLDRAGERKLGAFSLQLSREAVDLEVSVQTASYIDSAETAALQHRISAQIGRPVRLRLEQLQLARKEAEATKSRDYLAGGTVRAVSVASDPLLMAGELAKFQDRIRNSLERLLAPAGVRDIQVLSIGTQPQRVIRVEIRGTEDALTEEGIWRVAAAALSRELGGNVHLVGAVTLAGHHELRYAAKALYPPRAQLRKISASLAGLREEPRLRHLIVCSRESDANLFARRLKVLKQQLPVSLAEAMHESGREDNVIFIRSLQRVDALAAEASSGPPALKAES